MTVIEDRLIDFTLRHGAHSPTTNEFCLLEAVAWVAGEPWSDHPQCVDPVLGAFGRGWNDSLRTDDDRTRLLAPFIPRLVGTRTTPEVQDRRAFMAADWAVRTYTPAWLRLVGLHDEADALAVLNELCSVESCRAAMDMIRSAQQKAAVARDAARDAAGAAAWDAARDAAWDAARDAAGDAAWDAAGDAAWDAAGAAAWDAARAAARAAAGDAAGDAARDAAWAAAGAAARDAARDAAWAAAGAAARDAARAAAWAAAGDALAPTVLELQASAIELFDRMIALTEQAA